MENERNVKKKDFDQQRLCKAPVCWSKSTTYNSKNCFLTFCGFIEMKSEERKRIFFIALKGLRFSKNYSTHETYHKLTTI